MMRGMRKADSHLLRRYERRPPRDRVGRLVPARVGRRRAASVGQPGGRRRVRPISGGGPAATRASCCDRRRGRRACPRGRPSAATAGRGDRRELAVDPPGCRGGAGADDRARRPRSRGSVLAALGSVSQGVAHHARIPVVVVPPAREAEAEDAEAPAASSPLPRVLARLSGTREMDALARYVISEAERGRVLSADPRRLVRAQPGRRVHRSSSCSIGRTSSMRSGATRSPTCRAGSPRPARARAGGA